MARMFTGLQPSGALHIGNYFGALKPFVGLSREHESFLMIADYHALTTLKDPAALRGNILSVARDYIAAGIDPQKSIIFKQSDVPEHTELAWIFQCLVTVPFLERSHAYKDKVAKFNNAYGETFKPPKEHVLKGVAVVPGIDGKKMSKSDGNTIPLFGTKDEIAKAVMSIVTDSKAESPENVYAIHGLLKSKGELSELYKRNKGKYK